MKYGSEKWAYLFLTLVFWILSCARDSLELNDVVRCEDGIQANTTITKLGNMAGEDLVEIRDSLVLTGVVVSNDRAGNSFNEIILSAMKPEAGPGLRLALELRDSYLRFPPGLHINIQLKGLWVQKKHEAIILGKPFKIAGNLSMGRIPYHEIDFFIQPSCIMETPMPVQTSIQNMDKELIHRLVRISEAEFIHEEIGLALAEEKLETIRHLTDCHGEKLRMITSGWADFYDHIIPDAHGQITGIFMTDKQGYYLRIRNLEDLAMDEKRCRIPVEPETSSNLIISEIADPDNAPQARFIEIYNASDTELQLEGWSMQRYTNANTEVGKSTDLSGISMLPYSTMVLAADSLGFDTTFGFAPDMIAGKNSVADSNGDDTIVLVDPFGAIIDIFGRIGEDGSGTDHEFEDGRALRNSEITMGNPEFLASEWSLYNDTGGAGTIQDPQQAPADFDPGIKN